MKIGLIIVGDEILSGKRSDRHLAAVTRILSQRGLRLNWVRILEDDLGSLQVCFRETFRSDDLVFSTGGIGITPDDLTRQAVAAALGVELERHPEGEEVLRRVAKEFGREPEPQHYAFIEFPAGAQLIPNPELGTPGFSVGNHYFLPGFSQMAWPMIKWVLDNHFPGLCNNSSTADSVVVKDCYEVDLIPFIEELIQSFPGVSSFSLPASATGIPQTEIGFKGESSDVSKAMSVLKQRLDANKLNWHSVGASKSTI